MIFRESNFKDGDTVYLCDYMPQGTDNPRYFYDKRSKDIVLEFKKNDLHTVRKIAEILLPLLGYNFVLAAVPSSSAEKNGITAPFSLINFLLKSAPNRFIDGSGCVYRHKSKPSSHGEGNRDEAVMRDTLAIRNIDIIKNRDVLLIDDITTTGNSMKVIREMLKEQGANNVIGFAVGKAVSEVNLEYGFIFDDVTDDAAIKPLLEKIEKLEGYKIEKITSCGDSDIRTQLAGIKQRIQLYEGCITVFSSDKNSLRTAKSMAMNTVLVADSVADDMADFCFKNYKISPDEFSRIIESITLIRECLSVEELNRNCYQLFCDIPTKLDTVRYPRNNKKKIEFYTQQLQAVYVHSRVRDYIDTLPDDEKEQVLSIYRYIAPFELITNFRLEDKKQSRTSVVEQICMTAKNVVQRGMPTIAPSLLDDVCNDTETINYSDLLKSLFSMEKDYVPNTNRKVYTVKYANSDDGVYRRLASFEMFESQYNNLQKLGTAAQFVEINKPVEDIVYAPNTDESHLSNYASFCLDEGREALLKELRGDTIDLALVMPKLSNMKHNCISFRSSEVGANNDISTDLLREVNWTERRIDEDVLKDDAREFYYAISRESRDSKCVRVPNYVAKLTLAFLYLQQEKVINIFGNKPVNVAVQYDYNSEVILLAVQNAVNMLYHLSRMVRQGMRIQPVNVQFDDKVYTILPESKIAVKESKDRFTPDFTLVEKFSKRIADFQPISSKGKIAYLYSAYSECMPASVNVSDKPIKYSITEHNLNDLEYFLKTIFQKEHFRPKQFDIVAAALNRKNVIGLLPTGSGKTITFQLSALLQPQISIIISPLVALMTDQVYNLKKTCIDSCATINSTVEGREKRQILKHISTNRYQLIYVAPERLQMKSFKEKMSVLNVAHVILDEAHCVSQWGHDFRTAYLRVGESVERYFSSAVTMALTGTASCNVITDVKRELHMSKNVEVVTPTSFRRGELHFKVYEMEENDDLAVRINNGTVEQVINNAPEFYNEIERRCGNSVKRFFYSQHDKHYDNTGIVFCPFAKAAHGSVETMYAKMVTYFNTRKIAVGKYHGSMEDVEEKMKSQNDFVEGNTAILFATKAFGMGIDKPNIRYTIHTTIPESIEQFYQEAGRAGRDRNNAVNIIIAPPVKLEFEKIKDKNISDFFFNKTFPNEENFLRQIDDFLHVGQLWLRSYRDSILEEFAEDDTVGNMDIDCAYGAVNLRLGSGSDTAVYDVSVDGALQAVCRRLNELKNSLYQNKLFKIFEENVLSQLTGQFNKKGNLRPESFAKSFGYVCYDVHDSIIQVLKQGKKAVGTVCYIGVDNGTLHNPIDKLLRDLYIKKNGVIIVRNEFKQRVITLRKQFQDRRKREKLVFLGFFDVYNAIRQDNRLEPVTEQDFSFLWDRVGVSTGREIDDLQEKILYYLGILGVYSDYERCYAPDAIKITIAEVTKESIKHNIKKFISGYETKDYLQRQLGGMKELDKYADDDVENLVQEGLKYVISYAYEKIKAFRHKQAEIMYECIRHYDKKNDKVFEEEVYKYFESKYADELLKDVNNENLNLLDKWIRRVDSDSMKNTNANIRENLSHLRTSALKVQEARPQAFTPYLLYAYAILSDPDMDIISGLKAYKRGVEQLRKSRANYRTMLFKVCVKIFHGAEKYYINAVDSTIKLNFARDEELREMRNALAGYVNEK